MTHTLPHKGSFKVLRQRDFSLLLLAVFLTFFSCSDGDSPAGNAEEPTPPMVKTTCNLSVAAHKQGVGNLTFSKDEEVTAYVQEDNRSTRVGSLKAQNSGSDVVLSGELNISDEQQTLLTTGGKLSLLLVSGNAAWDVSTQDGTLAFLSGNQLPRTTRLTVTGMSGSQRTLVAEEPSCVLRSVLPVVHYQLKDRQGHDIQASRITISSADNDGERLVISGDVLANEVQTGTLDLVLAEPQSEVWLAFANRDAQAAPYTVTVYTDTEVFSTHLEQVVLAADGSNERTLVMDAISQAAIVSEKTYALYPQLKNLNFVYPSKGPFGEPVMLSGTISMGHNMQPTTKANGFLLYNHYTVCQADECPSRGKLDMQSLIYQVAPNSRFIIVSADHYGFGQSGDRMQAYCVGSTNARASLDALTAARQLLAERGYTWGDDLLNVGYSQGGQTTMAVLRLATEEYPSVRFTRTMAGGGPYDLGATYRQYLTDGKVKMPSVVVNILLAYNEFFRLGIGREEMFVGSALTHIDDWWLSKQYTTSQIDRFVGSSSIGQFVSEPLCDLDSNMAQRMMQALERENLCSGWKPRPDEHILLLHHEVDEIVPVVNTRNMYDFLKQQGVEDVELQIGNFFPLGSSDHVSGAGMFLTKVGLWIREHY